MDHDEEPIGMGLQTSGGASGSTWPREAASGNRRCAPPHPGPTHYERAPG